MIMKSDFSGVFAWRSVVGRSGLSDNPAVKDIPLSQVGISLARTTQFPLWAQVVLRKTTE